MKHLAELNIARPKYPQDDPRIADFYANLDRINGIADRMPGFVWRLKKGEDNNSVGVSWPGDPTILVNLSVWETVEALEKFVWQTAHTRIYNRKQDWFEKLGTPHMVFWWVEAGHIPTVAEAKERLDHLAAHGSSEFAFGWEGAAQAKLWRDKKCA